MLFPFFLTFTAFIFFTGDLDEHEDALKVEKSCFPSKILAPFLSKLKSNFFFKCHALFWLKDRGLDLFIIRYS